MTEDKIETAWDYQTRWQILYRLVFSEMKNAIDKEGCKIEEGEEMRRIMHWMNAIDNGIRDIERIRKISTEEKS